MTDKYDVDAHDHGHEHEVSGEHESKSESWQDDQPPVDDLMEETATASEEAGVSSHEEMAGSRTRKSSALLPITVAIGGLVLVAGVVHWQFGRSSSSDMLSSLPFMSQASTQKSPKETGPVTATASAKQPEISPPGTDVAPKTSLASAADTPSPAVPPSSAQIGTAMPVNPPSIASTDIMPTPSGTQTATPSVDAGSASVSVSPSPAPFAAPVLSPAVPTSTDIMPYNPGSSVVASAPSNPVVSPPVSVVPALSAADKEALDTRMASLSARIDELKKGLDQATQQIGQGGVVLAASSGPGSSALEDRLAKIEQQLSQLQHNRSVSAPAAAPVPSSTAAEQDPMTQATEAAAAAVAKPVVQKEAKVRHKKVKTHKSAKVDQKIRKVAKHGAKSSRGSANWVLRAATPDEAWIAKDESSAELKHVQVGDDLPGIGRVKSIHQAGDTWMIEGAQGSIQ